MNTTTRSSIDFTDLDDLDSAPVRATKAADVQREIPCIKCGGTGFVRYGYVNITTYDCRMCNGTGRVTEARIKRVAAAKKGNATREANLAHARREWVEAYPVQWAWCESRAERFDFARSMVEAVNQYGSLTPNQLAAVDRLIVKDAERAATRKAEAEANATTLGAGLTKLRDALEQAKAKGLKNPKIRTEHAQFSLAKAASRNPGCVYVVNDGLYLGKVDPDGKFFASRDCDDTAKAQVVEMCNDPLQAAIAYGRRTGQCSCCGRELTDPESIERGIGPICASKYF